MAAALSARPRTAYRGRARQLGFWNFVIPAAASLIGAVISGNKSKQGQEETNVANAQQAEKQMAFQEQMSSTSYQRGVKDMQAAGLNPMLAYSQGGASAPIGSQARMENPNLQLGQNIASSASQAVSMASAMQQMELTSAQADNTKAQTARTIAETLNPSLYQAQGYSNLALTHEQTGRTYWDARRTEAEIDNLVAQLTGIESHSASQAAQYREMKNRGGFAADVERRKAESKMAQLGLSEAKSTSDFFNTTGQMPKWVQMIMHILRSTAPYSQHR